MRNSAGLLDRSRLFLRVSQLCGDGVSAWHRFWFDPADPLMLGIMRILTGWMLFYNLLVWSLDLEAFFGNGGLQPLKAIQSIYGSRFVFSFWLWIGDSYLWPVHLACLAITAMFCLGLATRVTSILSFLITISYSQRVPVANFGFDQILGLLCLYLSIGPSGAAVSVDSVLRRWRLQRRGLTTVTRKLASARMAMRLIQLHLCAIYFWAGLAKLKGPSWWTGEAMWRVLANQEYQTMDLTWMAWVPWLPFLVAHLTILWEVFFIVLIWNHRLRPIVLAIGVGMHVGIGAFLGMWTFGLIMAFAYLAFSNPDTWRRRLLLMPHWFHRTSTKSDFLSTDEAPAAVDRTPASAEVPAMNSLSGSTSPVPGAAADHFPVSGTQSVCIIATRSGDRSMLRHYFGEHGVACRAVGDFSSGLNLLSRCQVGSVLVSGSGLRTGDLIDFLTDVADLADVPVLVMLTPHQSGVESRIEKMKQAGCIQLPASLKEIRLKLQSLQAPASALSPPGFPELNSETHS